MHAKQKILIALGDYKYLTYKQCDDLGICESTTAQKVLSLLKKEGKVDRFGYSSFAYDDDHPREFLYYLTLSGATELRAYGHKAHYPKTPKLDDNQDIAHNIITNNLRITCEKWGKQYGFQIGDLKTYFSSNEKFEVATTIVLGKKKLRPDLIFSATKETDMYFVLELTNSDGTKLVVEKFQDLHKCMMKTLYKETYGWPKTPRILAALKNNDQLRLVLSWIKTDPYFEDFPRCLFLSTVENLSTDFDLWVDHDGQEVRLSQL